MTSRIAFIGAGNMAEALVKGLVSAGVPADRITVTDPLETRLDEFRRSFGVQGSSSNVSAVAGADVVVLAVKPQILQGVLEEIRGHVGESALIVSIAAGIRTERIEQTLGGSARVVRVMPNTPALVGEGISAISGGRRATAADLDLAGELLGAVGRVVRVDEKHMDAVTAVSGSGPAYVFYLMEAMLAAARKLELDAGVARRLVYQTVAGAAKLAAGSDVGPEALRERVTSKGGTTAAAIAVLEERGVRAALEAAVAAAHRRSRELSGS
jgi:pyrroline-5-carboxylate reductase